MNCHNRHVCSKGRLSHRWELTCSQICCIALRVCKLWTGFSVPSIIWVGGGVNANHSATHSPSLARKNEIDNDPKLLKNSEGKREDEWNFCWGQEADIALFLQEIKIRNIIKSFEETSRSLPETARAQTANVETQNETKWIERHQSQGNMYFLRGPLRWLTKQKNPKFLRSLQKEQRDTTNLAITPIIINAKFAKTINCYTDLLYCKSARPSRHIRDNGELGLSK